VLFGASLFLVTIIGSLLVAGFLLVKLPASPPRTFRNSIPAMSGWTVIPCFASRLGAARTSWACQAT